MSHPTIFPLSGSQVHARARIQTQILHAAGNHQNALEDEAERERQEQTEKVNENSEAEYPVVDEDGHRGHLNQAENNETYEDKSSSGLRSRDSEPSEPSDDDDIKGRFINLVV